MKNQFTPIALSLALASLSLSAHAAPLQDARTAARGGAGVALSDLRATTINPASMVSATDAHVAISLGVGAFVSDADKAIDDIDDVQDYFEELESAIDKLQFNPGSRAEAESAKERFIGGLEHLDGKQLTAEAGGAFTVAVPARWVKAAVFAKTDARLAASLAYDKDDEVFIQDAIDDALGGQGNGFSSEGIKSTINASGIMVTDFGLALGQATDTRWGQLDYGTALKAQRITLIDRKMNIADEELADSFDDETQEVSGFNADIGVIQHFSGTPWRAAATVENLVPRTVKHDYNGNRETYKMAPQITVAGAYVTHLIKAEANLQLFKNNGFGEVEANQYLRLGAELGHRRAAQLRVGYIHDLKGNEKDLFTAGFGISPFDVFNLDVAGMVGGDRNMGVMVGLGLKI